MGQMEMKCIFDIGNIFILGKVSQVSNVTHGPLVKNAFVRSTDARV
jgi:hypothetical protein